MLNSLPWKLLSGRQQKQGIKKTKDSVTTEAVLQKTADKI